jgi:hypothetical protein
VSTFPLSYVVSAFTPVVRRVRLHPCRTSCPPSPLSYVVSAFRRTGVVSAFPLSYVVSAFRRTGADWLNQAI